MRLLSKKKLTPTQVSSEGVACCVEIPEFRGIVTGSDDGALRLHDMRAPGAPAVIWRATRDTGAVSSVAVRPVAPSRALFGYCGGLWEVDVRGSSPVGATAESHAERLFLASSDESSDVNCIAVHSDGSRVAVADDDGAVRVLDPSPRGPWRAASRMRPGHSNIAMSCCFIPHRPWALVSGGMDCIVACWDFSSGKSKVRGSQRRD